MLYRPHLNEQLRERRAEFVDFEAVWSASVSRYTQRLLALGKRSSTEIKLETERAIDEGAARAAGARPSTELEQAGAFVVPFKERWRSHEEARRWALEVLRERVTCAADGSQILPGREISLPVAAVQAAWFENPHTATGQQSYHKESRFELITPEKLLEAEGGLATAADLVGLRRFELELEVLKEFLERRKGWRARGERVPVAFFDGTLLLSTTRVRAESKIFPRAQMAAALIDAARLSRETKVPLVGYIDQSYARDLVRLLDLLSEDARPAATVFDARLLSVAPATAAVGSDETLFSAWGDRTIFCYCVREGMQDFQDAEGNPLVGFVYLQTTGEGAPARLDIPAWVYEAGLIDEVVDTVRAECVVGNGYPYALETADAAAVITMQDREQFLRAMQEFAAEQNLGFSVSRKPVSKARRR